MHRLAATAFRTTLLTAALAIGLAGCGGDGDDASIQTNRGNDTCTWGESTWDRCTWGQ